MFCSSLGPGQKRIPQWSHSMGWAGRPVVACPKSTSDLLKLWLHLSGKLWMIAILTINRGRRYIKHEPDSITIPICQVFILLISREIGYEITRRLFESSVAKTCESEASKLTPDELTDADASVARRSWDFNCITMAVTSLSLAWWPDACFPAF